METNRSKQSAYDLRPGDVVTNVWHDIVYIGRTEFAVTGSKRTVVGLRSALLHEGDIILAVDNSTTVPTFTVIRDRLPNDAPESSGYHDGPPHQLRVHISPDGDIYADCRCGQSWEHEEADVSAAAAAWERHLDYQLVTAAEAILRRARAI